MVEKIVGNAEVLLTPDEVVLSDRQVSAMLSGDTTKIEAEYQYKPHGKEKCSGCAMFVPGFPDDKGGFCTKVNSWRGPEGWIFPTGWCKFYEADELNLDSLSPEELAQLTSGLDEPPEKG